MHLAGWQARAEAAIEAVRTSFWFVPAQMSLAAIVLSFAVVALDRATTSAVEDAGWFYGGGADGARAVLSAVAGSVMTVAGVTFSITIAVLTLASNQFGPRLLRTFLRDTGNQVVLGTFIATFVYCLLVLRTVRADTPFVPHIAVTVGVALACVSMGVLIFFIHHVAVSIQVEHILVAVGAELDGAIERMFPEKIGEAPPREGPPPALPPSFEGEAHRVCATGSGYVQLVDEDQLMALATAHDLVLRVERRPGDFVVRGAALLAAWPPTPRTRELDDELRSVFVLGGERTLRQDVAFGCRQIVEIAVRALSPSVNDPFTAMSCLDHLGAVFASLAERATPNAHRVDDRGRLRVVAEPFSAEELVRTVFDPLREYARASTVVTLRLLDTLAVVAERSSGEPLLRTLRREVELLVGAGADETTTDHQDVLARGRAVLELIDRRTRG